MTLTIKSLLQFNNFKPHDQILTKIREIDPNNSEAVKDALSSFFQNLPKHTNVHSFRCLRALEDIINRFPKYCSSHRITIENYLGHFIDSNNYFNVIEAAKCAHSLQQVRPSQDKTATAKVCWREHQIVLCKVAHKLIGLLFSNSVDLYKGSENDQKTQLTSTADSPLYAALSNSTGNTKDNNVNKQYYLGTKLKNIFVFLQAMLVETYPVAKPIQPQKILEVIVRALNVSSGSKSTLDATIIAEIKIETLRTLDSMVACLGPNLIPFSPLIFRFILQTLRWSSENVNEESRKVRCSAYRSAAIWMRTLGVTKAGRTTDELAGHVLADITPARHVVQLTLNSQPTRHLSKKAKRKLANSMLQESSISSHMPGEKNKISASSQASDEVAVAALDFAETLLAVSGIFMNPSTYKMLQERLVRECYLLDNYDVERSILLLRALEAARRSCPPATAPHTQHCLQLFSALTDHRDLQISKFCSQALLEIRLQLHCAPPSLSFALETQEKQKPAEKRKKISEKNRAALAALLGRERFSDAESNEEGVIDISDEPSAKKIRKSTEIDKISVSSDSMESVVIQGESIEDESEIPTIEHGETRDSETCNELKESEFCSDEIIMMDGKEIIDVDNCENPDVDISISLVVDSDVVDHDNIATQTLSENIHEAKTQMPLNASNETIDEERSPLSMEVAYDFPNTGKSKVTVLDRIDDENLPSTNDTDDVQITCGQVIRSSQENDTDKNKEANIKENGIKLNGNRTPDRTDNQDVKEIVANKMAATKDITVEDMLADFVDEVNE